jgi:hypothetical protein
MTDTAREKYARLMDEIERLEDAIEEMKSKGGCDTNQLSAMNEALTVNRNELARLSDGCGRPHPN